MKLWPIIPLGIGILGLWLRLRAMHAPRPRMMWDLVGLTLMILAVLAWAAMF